MQYSNHLARPPSHYVYYVIPPIRDYVIYGQFNMVIGWKDPFVSFSCQKSPVRASISAHFHQCRSDDSSASQQPLSDYRKLAPTPLQLEAVPTTGSFLTMCHCHYIIPIKSIQLQFGSVGCTFVYFLCLNKLSGCDPFTHAAILENYKFPKILCPLKSLAP